MTNGGFLLDGGFRRGMRLVELSCSSREDFARCFSMVVILIRNESNFLDRYDTHVF